MSELVYGGATVEVIKNLVDRGIKKMSVMMRHSARQYDPKHPEREPFMLLTEEGKEFAFQMGKALPTGFTIHFFSSFVARCIETAYLLDKGYTTNQGLTVHNQADKYFSPSYIKKHFDLLPIMEEQSSNFIRYWFEGNISPEIIDPLDVAATDIVNMLKTRLSEAPDGQINLGVTHDWNIYPVKEHFMGLKHEDIGKIEYLEGVVVYEEQGQTYIVNHQKKAIAI